MEKQKVEDEGEGEVSERDWKGSDIVLEIKNLGFVFRHGKGDIGPSFRIENGSEDRFDFTREWERLGLPTGRENPD